MASNLKLEQKSYIKIRMLLDIGPKDILIDLEVVYGDASLSYTIVKEWAKRFREGRELLEDVERIERPRSANTAVTPLKFAGEWKKILISLLKS
ncbi:hypothetical protein LOD99_10881 [Oopsacas minuta]|uniref:Mos1 transposase HTH domain-containing protein n=1 Tax=Oopsacas minuta TaxID=111878 RepID=A0AAV7KCX0_9METZ|nr:hypothetical protein LOD99_10881 [Oopsacas minuta]